MKILNTKMFLVCRLAAVVACVLCAPVASAANTWVGVAATESSALVTDKDVRIPSPDGRYNILLTRVQGAGRKVTLVNSVPEDQFQPKTSYIDYLKPGDAVPYDRPSLIDMTSGRTVEIDNALFVNPWSLDRWTWKADGSAFRFVYNARCRMTRQKRTGLTGKRRLTSLTATTKSTRWLGGSSHRALASAVCSPSCLCILSEARATRRASQSWVLRATFFISLLHF